MKWGGIWGGGLPPPQKNSVKMFLFFVNNMTNVDTFCHRVTSICVKFGLLVA